MPHPPQGEPVIIFQIHISFFNPSEGIKNDEIIIMIEEIDINLLKRISSIKELFLFISSIS
jgi:hypothetical protein